MFKDMGGSSNLAWASFNLLQKLIGLSLETLSATRLFDQCDYVPNISQITAQSNQGPNRGQTINEVVTV